MEDSAGPVPLVLMNKRAENLRGCSCVMSGAHAGGSLVAAAGVGRAPAGDEHRQPHKLLQLLVSTSCDEDEEPLSLKVKDCMTVFQLKQLIAKETGLGVEEQALYSAEGIMKPLVGNKQLREYGLEQDELFVVVDRTLLGGSFCICFIPCPPPCCKKKKKKDEEEPKNYYPS